MTQHKSKTLQSPDESLPALSLAVETLKLAYSDFNETIESINNRAGVGLTLIVAAFAFVSFKIQAEQVGMFEAFWWIAAIAYIAGFFLLGYGGYCFLLTFRALSVRAAYSTKELHEEEYLKTVQDFQLKELSNFKAAVEAREGLVSIKSNFFNKGLRYTTIGLILFFTVQLIGSLIVLSKPPKAPTNSDATSSVIQTQGDFMSNPKPANNQPISKPNPQPKPPPPTSQPNQHRIETPKLKIGAKK